MRATAMVARSVFLFGINNRVFPDASNAEGSQTPPTPTKRKGEFEGDIIYSPDSKTAFYCVVSYVIKGTL